MLMKKFIGKPYAGKPHVRFDEGAGKGVPSFSLYSTEFHFVFFGAPRGVRKISKNTFKDERALQPN